MAYACQTCTKRKVKCDKATPTCSSCRKSSLECTYEPPRSRTRKRKLSDEVVEQLARYECILRQHGLLDSNVHPVSPLGDERASHEPGKIPACEGEPRCLHLNSRLWQRLEEHQVTDGTDEEDPTLIETKLGFPSDPVTGAFVGGTKLNLLPYHPTPTEARLLWETHMENVEPLCKILHIPSTSAMVARVSQEPAMASEADECLLFSIYHFALFSMSEGDCDSKLGRPRDTLLQQYHFAAKQALVNASFLSTTELPVLQALVLFLLASRDRFDAHTYWSLTGVAVRIAQRIGLHRDGQKLGLSPFEVEMRRRLFYQLMPLDARASQMAGVGISILPDTWDARPPLNINDDQIWPGMTETPEERAGPTGMIFCLSRACLGKFLVKTEQPGSGVAPFLGRSKHDNEHEEVVKQAESEVEEKFIRYCDVINPLHFLTICTARSGITAMRLRNRLPKAMDHIDSASEAGETLQLALKILDTDAAVCSYPVLEKYHWHTRTFFLWGTWDSFIFVLTHLLKRGTVYNNELNAIWKRVEAMYKHHNDLLELKRAFYVALGRLTLRAWEVQPPVEMKSDMEDPSFIVSLRAARDTGSANQNGPGNQISKDTSPTDTMTTRPEPVSASECAFEVPQGSMSSMMGVDGSPAFDLDGADWAFWDQLIQNHEAQNDQWQ